MTSNFEKVLTKEKFQFKTHTTLTLRKEVTNFLNPRLYPFQYVYLFNRIIII